MRYPVSNKILAEILGYESDVQFACANIGLVQTKIPDTLSYLADKKHIDVLNGNTNIRAVITNPRLAALVDPRIICIIDDDPVYTFWTLFNMLSQRHCEHQASEIASTAVVHPTAWVSDENVRIGAHSLIEANVSIYGGTVIGKNCVVRAGTVCGVPGFEHKITSRGVVSVFHDGNLIIADNVEIGPLNSCARGLMGRDTVIGPHTKTDAHVHVAHGVKIGQQCLIAACAEISGSVTIGDHCWLGPNCSIINGIELGRRVFVGIGAVVTKAVGEGLVVAGNPARVLKERSPI